MPFVCQDRAVALSKLGHDVHVITTDHATLRGTREIDGVTVHHLNVLSQQYSAEFAMQCNDLCRSLNPDIIHSDSLDINRRWWCEFSCMKVVTLHGFSWGDFLTRWNLFCMGRRSSPTFNGNDMMRERNAINTFDRVIGVSRHEHWMLLDLFGLPQSWLVYNPIDPIFFREPLVPPPTKRFICAAISGHGERMFDTAKLAAQEAGVELTIVSGYERKDMPHIYDHSTALIVPTAYAQGYDLTVAEAHARRRPVIASATGSYLRETEVNGWITTVPMGDLRAWTIALKRVQPIIPMDIADHHRPEVHAANWLEAVS
jgi:hypothetical protein